MTTALDARTVADALAGAGVEAVVSRDDEVTATVPVEHWVATAQTVRDHVALGCSYFDWLTAVDVGDEGFELYLHVRRESSARGLMLRTAVPRFRPTVPSITPLFPGANWPERETAEMFGLDFTGHPDLRPLLLPDTFDGYPLRKDFLLASRIVRPWPGAHDPTASRDGARAAAGGTARTRRHRAPGVPAPGSWAQPDEPEVP